MARQVPVKYLCSAGAVLSYWLIPGVSDFLQTGLTLLGNYDFHSLRLWLRSYGMIAPLASIALIIVQSVIPFVPGVVMTLMNAWLFGWMMGSLYSGIGALLGAALDFYLARWYGKPCLGRFVEDRYAQGLNCCISRYGVLAVFIARLIPIVPFKVVSYGAGFSNMLFRQFILVTLVGQMPAIVLYSILGQRMLTDGYAAIAIMVSLIAVGWIVFRYRMLFTRILRHFSSRAES